MINFRYHLISLVAVFLALAVGVVMGSAVIDKAVLETLEGQQRDIDTRIDEALSENEALRGRLDEVDGRTQRLADEAAPRLLADRLAGVPVVVLAMRGVSPQAIDAAVALLDTAGADHEGTLWFNERLGLSSDEQRRDLARALGRSEAMAAPALRTAAVGDLTRALMVGGTGFTGTTPDTVTELRDAGFVDFDPPRGSVPQIPGPAVAGTRVLFVTGPDAVLSDAQWARPLVEALVGEDSGVGAQSLLVVESSPPALDNQGGLTAALRGDDALSTRLSTVNRIDDFAGQLAVVLALQDLGEGRVGHYGRDAQRLIPAPTE